MVPRVAVISISANIALNSPAPAAPAPTFFNVEVDEPAPAEPVAVVEVLPPEEEVPAEVLLPEAVVAPPATFPFICTTPALTCIVPTDDTAPPAAGLIPP